MGDVEKKVVKKIILIVSVAMCAFHLYTSATMPLVAIEQRAVHYGFALMLVFLWAAMDAKNKFIRIMDYILAIAGAAANVYMILNWQSALTRTTALLPEDYFMGLLLIVIALLAANKMTGKWLPIIAIVFIAYSFLGSKLSMSNPFWFPPISLRRFVASIYFGTEGIFGSCLATSATFAFMFCLYAEFLLKLGAGDFLINISYALFGKIRGGPAKIAVVASGLFGTVSGNASSNVAATGSLTIPLMKRNGFKPEFAGAVEAAASTGGMIVPPVMGAAAFIMAEMVGISYGSICIAAFLPAILYYVALFIIVDLQAAKTGMKGMDARELPNAKETLKEGWHYLVSLVVLIVLLVVLQWSATKAAFWSIVGLVLVDLIKRVATKKDKITLSGYADILVGGAKSSLMVAAATGCAGIIVGIFTATTLNLRLSSILIMLAGNNVVLLLLYAALGAIVLGMALPALSVYIILAIVIAPALIQMGIPALAAHLFVFYFGCMAGITPPVGVSFYVAAGIAQADVMKTGFNSFKLAIAGFLVPFVFAFDQGILMQGSALGIIWSVITTFIGTISLAFALQGYLFKDIPIVLRIILGVAAIITIIPEPITTIIGLIIIIAVVAVQRISVKTANRVVA